MADQPAAGPPQDPLDAVFAPYTNSDAAPKAAAPTASSAPAPSSGSQKASPAPPSQGKPSGDTPPAQGGGVIAGIQKFWNRATDFSAPALKRDASIAVGTAQAAPVSVLRAPGQLIGGIADTGNDVGKFIGDSINGGLLRAAQLVHAPAGVTDALQASQDFADKRYAAGANGKGASLADVLSLRQSLGNIGYKPANEFLTQAVATLAGGEGTLLEKLAGAGVRAAVTTDTTGGKAAPSTPTEALAERGINAAFGVAGEGAAQGLGYLLSKSKGLGLRDMMAKAVQAKNAGKSVVEASPEDAARDALDRDFGSVRTQETTQAANLGEAQPEGQEVAQPSRHTDAQPDVQEGQGKADGTADQDAPSQGPHPLSQDANAALERAGAAERVPVEGPPLTDHGRIVVAPETKATMDEQGLGRGFTSPDLAASAEGSPVIFKETAEDGSQRVVGVTTREDLNGFVSDAQRIAADPEHINSPSGAVSGQWRLRPLGSSDDVAAFGRAMADRLPPSGGPISNETTLAAAKEMGFDSPADAHILAGMMSDKTEGLSQGLTAARLMQAKINETMHGLGDTDWTTVSVDDPRWHDALASYHNGYSFMQAFRNTKSEIARALQAMKIDLNGPVAKIAGIRPEDAIQAQPVPDFPTYRNKFGKTPEADLDPYPAGTVPPLPRTPKEFDDAVKLWHIANQAGSDAVNAFWKGVTFHPSASKYLRQSFANWFTAGLVSRPTTFMRDLIGPAVLGGIRTGEKSAGALMQAVQASILGNAADIPSYLAQAADAPKAYMQTLGDIGTSIKYGWDTAVSGESRLHGAQPYNFDSHGIPTALVDAASQGNSTASSMFSLGNAINKLPQVIHSLHGGINEVALRLSYLGEIRVQAMLHGREQMGLVGDELDSYVREAVMTSEDPLSGMATDVTSLENAQRTTFTKPVGDASQPIINSVSKLIGTMRENTPEIRYILPIYTVPANNLGETLRRMPVVGQMFRGTQQELSGSMGRVAQAEAYGRMLSGAAVLEGGMALARHGLLTGAGPSQPKDRASWEAQGFQPYSIKGPDGKWYSYNKIDMLGSLLGIPAGMYDATIYHAPDQDTPEKHVLAGVSALAEYFKDQSALKGVSDLLNFGGNPAEDEGYLRTLTKGIAQGFVPGFVQQGSTYSRDAFDKDKRISRDPWQAIQNALPFTSETLDPVRNFLGDVVHVPQYPGGVLPISHSETNPNGPQSPVLNELHRLFLATGYQPGVLPPGIAGAGVDQRDVKLEDGHSLYDARMRYRSVVRNDDGQSLEDALNETLQSDEYAAGFDGSPRGVKLADGDQTNRSAMIEKVFSQFDKLAKQQVASDSPVAARWLASAAVKQQNAPGVKPHTTQELASSDQLVQALGINMNDYIEKVKGQ